MNSKLQTAWDNLFRISIPVFVISFFIWFFILPQENINCDNPVPFPKSNLTCAQSLDLKGDKCYTGSIESDHKHYFKFNLQGNSRFKIIYSIPRNKNVIIDYYGTNSVCNDPSQSAVDSFFSIFHTTLMSVDRVEDSEWHYFSIKGRGYGQAQRNYKLFIKTYY